MRKTQTGFSLVETLVAITILLIVISGPLAISSSSAKSSSFSSEQVVAFFLAQEGLELAEKARDDLLVPHYRGTNPDPWTDFGGTSGGPYAACYGPTGCGLTIRTDNTGTLNVLACGYSSPSCPLYFEKGTATTRSRYTYTVTGTTVTTPYSRIIRFERINLNEVKVVSKVTWRSGSLKQQQEASVESRFFNSYGTN